MQNEQLERLEIELDEIHTPDHVHGHEFIERHHPNLLAAQPLAVNSAPKFP